MSALFVWPPSGASTGYLLPWGTSCTGVRAARDRFASELGDMAIAYLLTPERRPVRAVRT
ncbi:hypothetical protein ACFYXC_14440 [Streptomyces sp. NPDC002701]|uniref:hypothetical protein n=1 Tax=Streptomyces sp. NPDC002701 TaxID=3364661 RepID=UPI0036A433CC